VIGFVPRATIRRVVAVDFYETDHSPASKAILAYPSQYRTAESSSINSYTHSMPFLNMLAGMPVRLANS